MYLHMQKLPSGLTFPCEVAKAEVNKGKNRYKDMYACTFKPNGLLPVYFL